ncbi:MAG: zinc-dependent metalloprotease [Planctomycetota bacterium]|nr:zinc-dependent metalloprotease [Planctomycetota bacterium]
MPHLLLTRILAPLLFLAPLACHSLPTNSGSENTDNTAAASTEDTAKAEAPEETAEAKPVAASDKAADQKNSGKKDSTAKADKKEDKKSEDEDEEKKNKAQKKWDDTIEDLVATTGFFDFYFDESKLLLELDEASLGREFLYWGALNSGAGNNSVYRGAMLYDNPNVLSFQRRGEKKIVLVASNTNYAEPNGPRETRVIGEVLTKGYIRSFDIAAEIEDEGKVLIDIGAWLKSDNLKVARGLSGGKFSPSKDLSLITDVQSFPKNVDITTDMIFTSSSSSGNSTMADGRGVEVIVQHSFVALPDPGYKPRKFDQRVGYFFSERKELFDRTSDDNVTRMINRWRLQKKDPTADVSDPVKPIVYWVENSTPPAYRDAVKRGIEAWEPAFRKAGFSNAIVAKQMPDDADWDAADVRYAVVRWSEDENVGFAIGPSRQDPRTGETIDADITMQANFLDIYSQRFDTYIAKRASMSKEDVYREWQEANKPLSQEDVARDPRDMCQMLGEEFALQVGYGAMMLDVVAPEKTRDEFLQDMIQEVTAHEIGHTLGLRHNFKASTWKNMEELEDAEATMEYGTAGSFMDYPAVIIAPPGATQGEFFQSSIGPYDYWAIEYGYREFGSNEDKQLAKIAARSAEPGLEFGTDEDSYIGDPLTVTWDMGSNPVTFAEGQIDLAEWGLSQMKERAVETGDGFHKYARYYAMFYSMYSRAYQGLSRFVGGFTFNRDTVGQEGGRMPIVPIDPALQEQAISVMIDKGLKWEGGIPNEDRLLLANKKYGSFGEWFDSWSMDPLPRLVNSVRLRTLLPLTSQSLFERLEIQEALDQNSLKMNDVSKRVFDAVWPEAPNEYDLWTQSDYVDILMSRVQTDTTPRIKAMYDQSLDDSLAVLLKYMESKDPTVKAHGKWLSKKITRFRDRDQVELDVQALMGSLF